MVWVTISRGILSLVYCSSSKNTRPEDKQQSMCEVRTEMDCKKCVLSEQTF